MEKGKITLGIYEHYKGERYRVFGLAKHSETLEDLVMYEALYDNEISQFWVRPIAMFLEEVIIDGEKISRFKLIG